MPQKSLHYELDFFVDLKRQVAIKRYTHKKFWNVALHCVTSWFITWCGFNLVSCVLPSFFQMINFAVVVVICFSQDVNLAALALPGFIAIFYHVFYVTTIGLLQTLCLLMLVTLSQVFIGQKWLEGSEPFSGPSKSESFLFAVVDCYNEVFIAPFHFLVTFLLRLDLREDLRWQSDTELRKIMTRTQPVP